MKLRFLLISIFLIGCSFFLKAQEPADTIDYLIFTEVRMDHLFNVYAELTNVGDKPVDLNKFKVCAISSFHIGWKGIELDRKIILPNRMLKPGQSVTVGRVYDLMDKRASEQPWRYGPYTKADTWNLIDVPVHVNESGHAGDYIYDTAMDSMSVFSNGLYGGNGDCAWFIEYNNGVDSFAVDAVNVVFDATTNKPVTRARDVAGVVNGTDNYTLIRKYSIKHGNLNWDNARGIDITDSEWLPIPNVMTTDVQSDRISFWTIGNHGDFKLDENTLEPINTNIEVDFVNGVIRVPWGIRNDDHIMTQFKKKPGIAWHYDYAPSYADSAYSSARTGDKLTIYVAGSNLYVKEFQIVVKDQKPSDNLVVPMYSVRADGPLAGTFVGLTTTPFRVSCNNAVMDTIWDIDFGIRVDSLLKYLEKPEMATWEMKFLNNEKRTDVKDGDVLAVTAKNGDVKEYYLKVWPYFGSTNSRLSCITWPDIPEWYKGILGWTGDTIPNFAPSTTSYTITVPFDVEGIPAFVAKTADVNAKFELIRAKNLNGTMEDRTITINVTAADGVHKTKYTILLKKEKNPANIQPWKTDPFISQYSHREQQADWGSAWEFMNPGTEEIDMRDYMFAKGQGTPADVIKGNNDLSNRMNKYIFGLQWADTATWNVKPGIFVPDNNVNPIVTGGNVFVLASLGWWNNYTKPTVNSWGIDVPMNKHWNYAELDVNFRDIDNPWHTARAITGGNCVDDAGTTNTFWLFKIENDSVKRGLKPATDPDDFSVVDVWGYGDGKKNIYVNFNGKNNIVHKTVHFRKPQIYKGNSVPGASFGTTKDDAEWYSYAATADLQTLGFGWPWNNLMVSGWLGSHDMLDASLYKSTVSSTEYLVSEGFSMGESIKGVLGGTTLQVFLDKIIKADTAQTLSLKANGTELGLADMVTDKAELTVVSADKTNTSKYIIKVTASGLSDNALLTTNVSSYKIDVDGGNGTISGFGYGISVGEVLKNMIIPLGASVTVVDQEDKYLPLQVFNYDSVYVPVLVTNKVFFSVVAEDGKTNILYHLLPGSDAKQVIVTSSFYVIDQENNIINRIPVGTNVETFNNTVVASTGATMFIVDKYNFERVQGILHYDDKLIVTSADGKVSRTYYMTMIGVDPAFLYINSNVYYIDQTLLAIVGFANDYPTVGVFTSNVYSPEGSSIVVYDAHGNQKDAGVKLGAGDVVEVISFNGAHHMLYSVDYKVSVSEESNSNLKVFPNPSKGIVNINGLEKGDCVRIFNVTGALVLENFADGYTESINLESQKAGIYIIKVNKMNTIHNFKIVLSR